MQASSEKGGQTKLMHELHWLVVDSFIYRCRVDNWQACSVAYVVTAYLLKVEVGATSLNTADPSRGHTAHVIQSVSSHSARAAGRPELKESSLSDKLISETYHHVVVDGSELSIALCDLSEKCVFRHKNSTSG